MEFQLLSYKRLCTVSFGMGTFPNGETENKAIVNGNGFQYFELLKFVYQERPLFNASTIGLRLNYGDWNVYIVGIPRQKKTFKATFLLGICLFLSRKRPTHIKF